MRKQKDFREQLGTPVKRGVFSLSVVFGGGNISTEYSFDVRYTLKDMFSSVSIQEIISTAAVVMDFKRRCV